MNISGKYTECFKCPTQITHIGFLSGHFELW